MEETKEARSKGSKIKIYALSAVFILSVGLMVGFAIGLALEIRETGQGQAFYADLDVGFMSRQALMPNIQAALTVNPATPIDHAPEIAEEFTPFIDFDEMRELFPSIIGWIQSEGTVINYPIVQGTDNDFYLNHKPDRTRHRWGSIYMDYRNSPDFSDQNIIIYGHDMASGDMFGSLLNYHNQSYFEAHDSMFIFTPTANYVLMLFAGYVINATNEVPPMFFLDEDDFEQYIIDIRSRSIFTSDLDVNFGDQLVFLATCTRGGSVHDRLILVGRLVEI